MKLTKEEFEQVVMVLKQNVAKWKVQDEEIAQVRSAIADHDPELACLLLDSQEASDAVYEYLRNPTTGEMN